MIPKGLPGAGNILIFDNGGWAGYGAPSRTSKDGTKADLRDHSRIIELDPVTLKVVWEFDGSVWGGMMSITSMSKFYSPLISSAQRLPNGNTLIDEGCSCRMFEVDPGEGGRLGVHRPPSKTTVRSSNTRSSVMSMSRSSPVLWRRRLFRRIITISACPAPRRALSRTA